MYLEFADEDSSSSAYDLLNKQVFDGKNPQVSFCHQSQIGMAFRMAPKDSLGNNAAPNLGPVAPVGSISQRPVTTPPHSQPALRSPPRVAPPPQSSSHSSSQYGRSRDSYQRSSSSRGRYDTGMKRSPDYSYDEKYSKRR